MTTKSLIDNSTEPYPEHVLRCIEPDSHRRLVAYKDLNNDGCDSANHHRQRLFEKKCGSD